MTVDDRPWSSSYPESLLRRPSDDPTDLLTAFRATVAQHASRPAVRYFGTTTTWAELDRQSDALAVHFEQVGVGRGDRVAVYLQNVPAYVVTVLATWKRGATVVPVNPMYRERELTLQLTDSRAAVLVCLRSGHPVVAPVLERAPSVRAVVSVDDRSGASRDDPRVLPADVPEPAAGTVDLETVVRSLAGRRPAPVELGPGDVAFLSYTSGTTGPPKAAMNTHGQVMWVAACWRDVTGTTVADVQLGMAPLFHITGLAAVLALGLLTGAPVVLTYRFEPSTVLDAVRETRPTVVTGAITGFMALAGAPGAQPEDFSSWRALSTGGAPVAPATAARFEQLTGKHLHPGYGLTETASACHMTPMGAASPVDPVSGALSVGIPMPGIDAVILDDDGNRLPPGEVGEIAVAGPSVVTGYWQRPEENAAAFTAGLFRTGDIGLMDEAGWFFVVDRKKDQINTSGYKVWPREVEDVLYEHPAVREVAVVGAPDEYRGETVVAHVSLQPGAAASDTELIAFAQERMAAYKYPRRVVLHDELPKTVSGKILRRDLRRA